MRTIVGVLTVLAVLLAWGLPSGPAQAEGQRGKQASSPQKTNTEPRDARDEKEPTVQDMKTKPSRDTSGLKDTSRQGASKPQGSQDSRDARDDKEAGSGSYK